MSLLYNKIYQGDSLELIKELSDDSIDLLITSPPYSDMRQYGTNTPLFHPDHYAQWLIQFNPDIYRVLKPSGSFILNINDKIHKKQRHIYVMDYVVRSVKETQLKLYDRYFWVKIGPRLPTGGPKRLDNNVEYLFHFVKDVNKVKWNMSDVGFERSQSTLDRYKSATNVYGSADDGTKTIVRKKHMFPTNDFMVPPVSMFFNNNTTTRGNQHPAPFGIELPNWFIKALTDKGDTVLDIFMGSGTTAEAALLLDRKFIGFEINETYVKLANKRLAQLLMREKYFG
jgi:site-specific DNA-methyltransferase (adenine-specific)